MNIIGLAGKMGVGKDTAASVLVEKFGFASVALADPMKRACAEWFGWDEETLWGPSEKRNTPDSRYPVRHPHSGAVACHLTPRFALQTLGTQFGRVCYEDVWINYAMRVAKALIGADDNPNRPVYSPYRGLSYRCSNETGGAQGVCISDVRFPNEVAAINTAGGRVWRLVRPDADASSTHASETSLDKVAAKEFDRVILNTGTLADFRETIEVIGQQLFDTGLR